MVSSVLPFFELRALAAIAFTAGATYFDLTNNKNVPTLLLYGFVIAGVLLNLATMAAQPLYAFGIPLAVLAIGYVFYRLGLFGSADAYTFVGISLFLPFVQTPFDQLGIQYPFILSVLTATTFIFGITMLAKFVPFVYRKAKAGGIRLSNERKISTVLMALVLAFFIYTISQVPFLSGGQLALLALVVVLTLFFTLFKNEIMDSFIEEVPPARVEVEDILAIEHMPQETVKKFGLQRYVDGTVLKRLAASGLEMVPVYKKLPPFEPYILAGLIISLLLGDLFFWLAKL